MISTTVPQSRSGFNFYTSLIFILCLSLSGEVIAGAWTAKQGASYQKLGANYFFSDEVFDDDGNRKDVDADFTDVNLTYYGEYGVTDRVTAFASIPYKWIKNDPDDGDDSESWGIGDQEYGLRYNLFNEDWGVLSIQGLVKVPDLNDEEDDELPLGNDQVDYEFRLLYGRSLYPKPVYFGLEAGYRFRRQEPSDEIKYLVEIGYNINENYYLRTKLDGTLSADNADDAPPPGSISEINPTLAPQYDLGKLELTAGYKFDKKFSTEFTWTPNIYGQNTAAGNNIQFAVIMQLP